MAFIVELCQIAKAGLCNSRCSVARIPTFCHSTAGSSLFHTSSVDLEARVPNPQKRLQRPHLVNPKELDRYGNPIYRVRFDNAETRAQEDLLEPIEKWDLRNRVVYPPVEEVKKYYQDREEECPRIQPPFVVHSRQQIMASPKRLRFAAHMVLGMNVDEACDQLDLHPFEEAQELKETIREAQDLAVNNHGFEFRSNMYLAFSEVRKGQHYMGVRKLGKGRFVQMAYKYSNYIVCLVEGEAPKDLLPQDHEDGSWKMENRLRELRSRTIPWDFKFDRPHAGMKRS